jgi:hypothetical protein
MKHIKTFEEISEGKGRYEIDGNMAVFGANGKPQFYSTKPDYMSEDDKITQKPGLDAKQLVASQNYAYLTNDDDHIDPKKVKKLIEPHVKKFNDFGFTPDAPKVKSSKKK